MRVPDMASTSKRSWKLQEFVAHNANVNCLALGHKSGRVMVTGGDDKKVNLWAVGKQSCFMSLSGHTTPIECVQFNYCEELVCAGSRAGALKVWDLEAAKLVRTLTGHRDAVRCVDFHPYGDFLVSGSSDSSIKLWDSRKRGCIFTVPGHTARVNSVKFSPDGQWIASGGEEGSIKIWEVRMSRVLKEFTDHMNSVTCVEFHPHEFLLASGSADRSVHFFDLENFNLVSTERDAGSVRCLWFNPEGECLFVGVRDYVKVLGWEPNRLYDSVALDWGRVSDISTAQHQLVGASFHLTNVTVYVVDLKKVQPFGGPTLENSPSTFTHNQSFRKSFSRAERPVTLKSRTSLDVKTIEESTSGTDPEEDSSANITNLQDYNDIFNARKSLVRTPPLEPEPFMEPESESPDPTAPQILTDDSFHDDHFEPLPPVSDNNLNYEEPQSSPPTSLSPYSRSKSNLDQVYVSRPLKQDHDNNSNVSRVQPTPRFNLQRQSSCKDVPDKLPVTNNIKHSVSDASLSRTTNQSSRNHSSRKNSFSRPSRNASVPNVNSSKIPTSARHQPDKYPPIKPLSIISNSPYDIYVSSDSSTKTSPNEKPEHEYVPTAIDRPVGLDFDDFVPKNNRPGGYNSQRPELSESEVLDVLMRGHDPMMSVLCTRQRNLKIVLAQLKAKDAKAAIETAISLKDSGVIVDILGVFNIKSTLWNLDLCSLLLPKLEELLHSKYESYVSTACRSIRLILTHFGQVIKTCVQTPVGSFGVDISREERYKKSLSCFDSLSTVRTFLLKKQAVPGALGQAFRELHNLLQGTFD